MWRKRGKFILVYSPRWGNAFAIFCYLWYPWLKKLTKLFSNLLYKWSNHQIVSLIRKRLPNPLLTIVHMYMHICAYIYIYIYIYKDTNIKLWYVIVHPCSISTYVMETPGRLWTRRFTMCRVFHFRLIRMVGVLIVGINGLCTNVRSGLMSNIIIFRPT